MKRTVIFGFVIVSALLFAGTSVLAQDDKQIKIESVDPFFLPPSAARIRVTFDQDLDKKNHPEDLSFSNVTIKALPSNKTITPTAITIEFGSEQQLLILYDPTATPPDLKDTDVSVCFGTIHFLEGTPKVPKVNDNPVCGKGTLITAGNIGAQLQAAKEELSKTPKTSTEKNVFASGFASKGEGQDAQGGTEIHLNSNDLGVPGLFASFHLLKSTADAADQKNFESALTYRQTHIIGRADLEVMRQQLAISRDQSKPQQERDAARQKVQDLIKKAGDRKLGAILFDFAGRFEGQALNFKVTNFVGDGMLQVQSRILRVGSSLASWKFRMIPAGIEAGKNLNNGSDTMQTSNPMAAQDLAKVNYIIRYKAGGDLNFYYNNPQTTMLFKRIELDLRFVARYLFRSEVMFNETTKMNDMTDKGFKPYAQADLKFYFASTPNGRLGFKVNYSRGSLPPVFAETKAFQFGFIIESADDTKTAK